MKLKLFSIILLTLITQVAYTLPIAKITVKVIDEQGVPIADANAGMGFMSPKGRGEGWGTNSSRVSGITDSDGIFVGEGETQPQVSYGANKVGYYGVGGKFKDFTGVSGFVGFRKYEPWNPTVELALKKIINPIPMYAVNRGAPRKGELPIIPLVGRFVGYDLMINDWMAPHGLGTHRDFLFKVDIDRAVSYRDHDVTLTLEFSNAGDGLIKYTPDTSKGKSLLRFPHQAPITGYEPKFVRHYEARTDIRVPRVSSTGDSEYQNNYFFRVRTELDNDGNVVGGLYGKIHGRIKLSKFIAESGSAPKPNISFNYYLNPNNNDTNIEYNPEKNLFKDVPDRLKVSQP